MAPDHLETLDALATHAIGLGDLQFEFGKEHVGFIIGCNQFLRIHRGGDCAGKVELRLSPDGKKALEASGANASEPRGAVFKMFGWTQHDPMAADLAAFEAAIDDAFAMARDTQAAGAL